MDPAAFLMHRVDAARRLMSVPGRGAEATGRLFLAKRCHEAAKAGLDVVDVLDQLVRETQDGLSDASHEAIAAEAEEIRAGLDA